MFVSICLKENICINILYIITLYTFKNAEKQPRNCLQWLAFRNGGGSHKNGKTGLHFPFAFNYFSYCKHVLIIKLKFS